MSKPLPKSILESSLLIAAKVEFVTMVEGRFAFRIVSGTRLAGHILLEPWFAEVLNKEIEEGERLAMFRGGTNGKT